MSKKISTIPVVSPRPYLQIVKSLKLTRNQSEVSKSKKITHQLPSLKSAANDEAIEEGSRNNILFSLAGSMLRRGMSQDAILAALIQENISRCSPPLEQEEIIAIATGITRYTPVSSDELLRSFTDMGNARRFMKSYSGKVIYVAEMGWFIWNHLKWMRSQKNIHIMQLAKEVARDIYLEGESLSDDERIKISKHAKSSQSLAKLKAMIELAQSEPELVKDSNAIDAHDMLLGVANGVIDLNNGKLLEPNPEYLITRHSPIVFDKDAQCPIFLNFISQITGGDKQLINYLQVVMGYCLTGVTKEHCFFFLHGSGANGKSTFLKIISEMLGSDLAIDTPSETLMMRKGSAASNDIARMAGVRVVISNEVEDGSLLAESLVKQITGGDSVTARFLFQEYCTFVPKFKLLIAGNHKPTIRGRDDGIWRRIQLIPFEVSIPPAQRDKNLIEKLRTELPGILNWAIKGCKKWLSSGLEQPKKVHEAVEGYRDEMDLISQWINANCVTGNNFECKVRILYQNYSGWAIGGGYKPLSESVFSREIVPIYKRDKRRDANYFLGIDIRNKFQNN